MNPSQADPLIPEGAPVQPSASPFGTVPASARERPRSPHPDARPSAIDTHTWVGIVANRSSGTGRGMHLVKRLVTELRRVGFKSEVAGSVESRGNLVEKSAHDLNCRCLIAVGGDGTVAALLNEKPQVPITVLPAGTENLVARHFGLKRNPKYLARLVAAGRFRSIDVGTVQGRAFLLMVGFGFDGDVVTRHHQSRISSTGGVKPTNRMAYVEPILRSSLSYRFPRITVRILDEGAGEVIHGTTVLVFNLPKYALGLPFVPPAKDDDGWLDLIVFREPGPFRAVYYLWKVLLGSHLDDPSVYHRRVRKISVSSESSIPVQIDGDPGGYILPALQDSKQPPESGAEHHFQAGHSPVNPAISSHDWQLEISPSTVDVIHRPSTDLRSRDPGRQKAPADKFRSN